MDHGVVAIIRDILRIFPFIAKRIKIPIYLQVTFQCLYRARQKRWALGCENFMPGFAGVALSKILQQRHKCQFQKNGFALFNGKHKTTLNENYEINMGHADRSKYYQIERWGPGYGKQLYKGKDQIL